MLRGHLLDHVVRTALVKPAKNSAAKGTQRKPRPPATPCHGPSGQRVREPDPKALHTAHYLAYYDASGGTSGGAHITQVCANA